MDPTVKTEFEEKVVRITLNRPAKRNPLDKATVRELAAIVRSIEEDAVSDVVVIQGAGGNFSAGGDLNGYISLYQCEADFREFLETFHGFLNMMEASRKIYIAAVEGYCVAGGLELILACDLVLAARSAKIGDAHLNFGQLPGAGGSQRLPRSVGPLKARDLMLTGKLLKADDAERIGLVSQVCNDGELQADTDRLIAQLLNASSLGLAGMKHLARKGMDMPLGEALQMELDYVLKYATTSNDASEGLVAFKEKRKPRFTGT